MPGQKRPNPSLQQLQQECGTHQSLGMGKSFPINGNHKIDSTKLIARVCCLLGNWEGVSPDLYVLYRGKQLRVSTKGLTRVSLPPLHLSQEPGLSTFRSLLQASIEQNLQSPWGRLTGRIPWNVGAAPRPRPQDPAGRNLVST